MFINSKNYYAVNPDFMTDEKYSFNLFLNNWNYIFVFTVFYYLF